MSAVRFWNRLSPWTRDAALAVLAAGLTIGAPALDFLILGVNDPPIGMAQRGWPWLLMVLAASAPLTLSRRFPLSSVIATGMITLVSVLIGQNLSPWPVMIGAYVATYRCERRRLPVLVVGAPVWMLTVAVIMSGALRPSDVVYAIGFALMPVSFGYALRVQRDYAFQLQRLHIAERQRAQAEERARIARDVHDVAGHHLSAIRLRAMGGRREADGEDALRTVAELSAEALSEIRGLIEVLRDDEPRLTELPALATRLSCPGLTVTVKVSDLPELPERLHGCGYRIAQEALTNVVRHSGASTAEVSVRVAGTDLVITVEDDGTGADTVREGCDRKGSGLRGMRERAEQLGGSVVAGPRSPRGWLVHATLPVKRGLG
ncbi:sensor histidine kinase [Allokutzneria sp. A3M-2-11 16]|uniref:sensor histidine kinase n=1 Tax=Allokutzneria sp. A3M-2-11 16 TaxID=2962043 RepID=UPI0020B63E11|nr:sensor histidine kinase [Allokutzneria sp. A3M-2-11 16]MCP3799190.1 sensor histidine kinase [Allokutzneria sp. A3M-2-11 16]